MEPLTDDELKVLKEVAQNLMATNRVRRMFTTGLLWLSGIVAAGIILWNAASNLWGKG